MAFTGDEGDMIDPATAQRWIENYQKSAGPGAIKAEFFGFRKLAELLGQKEAIGVRIYYGQDEKGVNRLIVVAVNPNETNIAPLDGTNGPGLVLENGGMCPPFCNKE